MKKILIFVLLLIIASSLLISCDFSGGITTAKLDKISFSDCEYYYDGTEKNLTIVGELPKGVTVKYYGNGQIDVGEYTVIAKFYKNGKHISDSDMKATLRIKKAVIDVSEIVMEDKTVVYDANPHSLYVSGSIPKNVKITYEGNERVDAGIYTVTAHITSNNDSYELNTTLSATLTVKKAAFDMSGVKFEDATVRYNGKAQSLFITGDIPDGVSVSYEGNEMVGIGEYNVKAKFTHDNKNYEEIPDREATLTIIKGVYDMSGISFNDKTVSYDGRVQSLEITGTLPRGITVTYENNGHVNIGEYTVIAKFDYDKDNYEAVDDMTAVLKIELFSIRGVSLRDKEFVYDGESKSLWIDGNVPDDVEIIYSGNGKTDAGVYEVKVEFITSNMNYGPLPPLTARLTILKADLVVTFDDKTVDFNGEYHSIYISEELPEGIKVSYKNNTKIAVGEHTVIAEFEVENPNYNAIDTKSAVLNILKSSYITQDFVYTEKSDGTYEITSYKGIKSGVIIPEIYNRKRITSIASEAFENSKTLIYIYISDNITNIGNNAFRNSTLAEMRLSNNIEVIGYEAFAYTELTSVLLPDSLKTIMQGAFLEAPISEITLPFIGSGYNSSNAYLGYIFGASSYVKNSSCVPPSLRAVTLSDACRKIPQNAFFGCEYITDVTIGKSVDSIGNSAFRGCKSLKSIFIPSSVKSIPANVSYHDSPFYEASDSLTIILESKDTSMYGIYFANVSSDKKATVIYVDKSE